MVILVSACLLGAACRYDGKSKTYEKITSLTKNHTLIPICPEIYGGLPTPRVPAEVRDGKVINEVGLDVSENYERGAKEALRLAKLYGASLAILKSRSPSCGHGLIYDGSFSRTLTHGDGVCAGLLIKNGITVINEEEIDKINTFTNPAER